MYYELALISVVVAGAYWGWYFLSKQPSGTLTFGIMQLSSALNDWCASTPPLALASVVMVASTTNRAGSSSCSTSQTRTATKNA